MTFSEYMVRNNIKASYSQEGECTDEPYRQKFRKYTVIFRNTSSGITASFGYFMGHGIANAPKGDEVLWSIASDSYFFYENSSAFANYENFANTYGYDTDSRKGEAIFRQCHENAKKLDTFLGEDGYAELMDLYASGVEE